MQIDHLEKFWSRGNLKPEAEKNMIAIENLSNEDLIIEIAQNKSRKAYAALFNNFAPRIKSFVMGQGLNAIEAEDLAQDAMLLVWRKAHLYDKSKAKASTWIFTITRNLRIDLARKQKRVKQLPEDLWHDFDQINQETEIINAQNKNYVEQSLSILNEEQLQVLKLSFYENLSHSQISNMLNIPLGTVKSRIRLAMTRMKDELKIYKGKII